MICTTQSPDVFPTYLLNLLRSEFKRHGAQVIAQPLFLARGRDGHDVLVDAVSQTDLAGVDGVFVRQGVEDIVGWAACAFRDWR